MSTTHRLWSLAFAVIMAAGPVTMAEGVCKPIQARLTGRPSPGSCESPLILCAAGVITQDGWLEGDTVWGLFGTAPSAGMPSFLPPSTLSYAGRRQIVTKFGTLTLRFVGAFDSATGEFADYQQVIGGTGKFENARGTLALAGTFFADRLTFQADVIGTICVAR